MPVAVLLSILPGCTGDVTSPPAMPNPASVHCDELGGELELVEEPDGVTGYCLLPSGIRCEEWALYRGECPPPEDRATSGEP